MLNIPGIHMRQRALRCSLHYVVLCLRWPPQKAQLRTIPTAHLHIHAQHDFRVCGASQRPHLAIHGLPLGSKCDVMIWRYNSPIEALLSKVLLEFGVTNRFHEGSLQHRPRVTPSYSNRQACRMPVLLESGSPNTPPSEAHLWLWPRWQLQTFVQNGPTLVCRRCKMSYDGLHWRQIALAGPSPHPEGGMERKRQTTNRGRRGWAFTPLGGICSGSASRRESG